MVSTHTTQVETAVALNEEYDLTSLRNQLFVGVN